MEQLAVTAMVKRQQLAPVYERAVEVLQTSYHVNAVEATMIRLELASPRLSWLTEDELHNGLVKALAEVKILTGALLHDGELLDVQIEVLKRFLISSPEFSQLNFQEFLNAFYLNSQGGYPKVHSHYNKEINAEFVGAVLWAYLDKKAALLRRVMPKIRALTAPAPEKKEVTVQDYQEVILQDYEKFRAGEREMIFFTREKYMFLRRCGLIIFTAPEKFGRWLERARYARKVQQYNPGDKSLRRYLKETWEQIEQTGIMPKAERIAVVNLARRMMYLEFFSMMEACGINNFFTEVDHRNHERHG